MKTNERSHLKKAFDRIDVGPLATSLEQRIYQDWQSVVATNQKPSNRISEVLVMAKLHPKSVIFIAIVTIAASVLLGQHFYAAQEDDLHRIDVLSELSLSTI
jgi:hypothetical protein